MAAGQGRSAPSPSTLQRLAPRLLEEELLGDWRCARAPEGCGACRDGYTGRVGLFETLEPKPGLLLEVAKAPTYDAQLALLCARTRSLREGALLLAEAGVTSMVEALRVTPPAPRGPAQENAVA